LEKGKQENLCADKMREWSIKEFNLLEKGYDPAGLFPNRKKNGVGEDVTFYHLTVIFPAIAGWMLQWKSNMPVEVKVKE
jgi:hypothetical protein